MKRLVAWSLSAGFSVILGLTAFGAQAAPDQLEPFLGQFQGQTGPVPGNLYVPLWSKPDAFELAVARQRDELVFAISGSTPVVMRFIPLSSRLYVMRTNKDSARETGFAWVDGDTLTIERTLKRPGQQPVGMRFVVSWEDDHRRLAAYTVRGGRETEVLDTALKGAED
jgi:hypothetical protein